MSEQNSPEPKLKKADIEALFNEQQELISYIKPPKPDPNVWPPPGWEYHPNDPRYVFRCVLSEDLGEELFGSPEKTAWLESAKERLEEIRLALVKVFFPKKKQEGTERITKFGFHTMLKTGLDRKFDLPVVAEVVENVLTLAAEKKLSVEIEDNVLRWEPKLDLKAFRELPPAIQKAFEACLVITPEKETFEIVREVKETA